jgi:hypothetical protein
MKGHKFVDGSFLIRGESTDGSSNVVYKILVRDLETRC